MLKTLKFPLVAVALLTASAAVTAAEDPSAHQIYEAVQAGNLVQAQQMITQVLKDHPDSARAHYIAAEVDAKSGDLNAARQQLTQARAIDPKLAFADAHSTGELEAQLAGRSLAPGVAPGLAAVHHSSVPWGLILILGAGGLLLWSLFRRRQAAYYAPQPPYGQGVYGAIPPAGPGPAPGYGYGAPYPPQGGMGSGIVGGLATGLAVGAGVAAGEALVDHMLDDRHGGYVPQQGGDPNYTPVNQDEGGQDFGTSGGDSWGDSSSGGGDFFGGGGGGSDGGSDWT